MNPLASIIILTYHQILFLPRSLESILAQAFTNGIAIVSVSRASLTKLSRGPKPKTTNLPIIPQFERRTS